MNNLSVTKSNSLIDASYKLNSQAQKLILACLGKVDSIREIPKEITITASEFGRFMGVTNNARRDLYKAADALFRSSILLKDGNNEVELYWIQEKAVKIKGDGAVRIVWSDKVLKYISQIRGHFTSYKLHQVAKLQSGHSIRLFELLMRFKETGIREIHLDDFKSALGLTGRYKEFKILKRDVINLAVKEINKHSDLIVTFEPIKKGRSVVSLRFEFKQDKQLTMDL